MDTKVKVRIKGVPSNYNSLPFGRQLEYRRTIQQFQETAKRAWISQKRISHAKAWKLFLETYQPVEYYTCYLDGQFTRDDSFEVYYKTSKES